MKKILAPTDFSHAAKNAVEYAVQLALQSNAKLILFHAYHSAPLAIDVPAIDISLESIKENSMLSLMEIRAEIIIKYGNKIDVECHNSLGFPTDEINDYAIENDIELIVMGMQGGDFLTEKVVGSITTSLMREAPCPVLVIDREVSFAEIKKVVLTVDYLKIPNFQAFDKLKAFLASFKATSIYTLNVISKSSEQSAILESLTIPRIHQMLDDMEHTVNSIESEDIVTGIKEFVDENKADLVVMIPRRHSLWRTLFYAPLTKKMAFHTNVPLLILQP